MSELNWTEAQWQKVNTAITEEFGKGSVASQFLPCYGPLGSSVEVVRKEELSIASGKVTIADDSTTKLFNIRVRVELTSQQIADESLSSALLAFRRAASLIARVSDHVVFNGYAPSSTTAVASAPRGKTSKSGLKDINPSDFVASTPTDFKGLLEAGTRPGGTARKPVRSSSGPPSGADIVTAVVNKISELELEGHYGPFACVLGADLFSAAHEPPVGSMVLPADRITPLLNGPLLRASALDPLKGVVVSLAPGGIDIVVGTPPKAHFLHITDDAKYVFRVYVRSVMRIKDEQSPGVVTLDV